MRDRAENEGERSKGGNEAGGHVRREVMTTEKGRRNHEGEGCSWSWPPTSQVNVINVQYCL